MNPSGAAPPGLSLRKSGEERERRFRKCLARAARNPSPAAVHDLRVSVRRLQALLVVAGALESPGRRERRASTFLRSLMEPLGRLRDAQVRLQRTVSLVPEGDEGSYLFTVLTRSEAEREEALLRRVLAAADPSIVAKALPPKGEAMLGEEGASRALRRLAELHAAVEELREGALARDEELHRLRLRFKRFRYAAEVLLPLLPPGDGAFRERLDAFQSLLGDVQDLHVLLARASGFRSRVLLLPEPTALERAAAAALGKATARARRILRDRDAFRSALFGTPSLPFGDPPAVTGRGGRGAPS